MDGGKQFATLPVALYGIDLLLAAVAYYILQTIILRRHGEDSLLAKAIGNDLKGKISPILYVAAIILAFYNPWIAGGIYVFVALIWLIPDKRIERIINTEHQ
jgi:uncharacterized membrane protein